MVIEANLVDIRAVNALYTQDKQFGAIKIEGTNEDGQVVVIYLPSPLIAEFVNEIVKSLVNDLEEKTT
jgi:hypothetical protein